MNKINVGKNLIIIAFATLITTGGNGMKSEAFETEDLEPPDHYIQYTKVNREENLRKFFRKYDSPLEDNVNTFIQVADKYEMDYRLLPAIACLESACGKMLIPGSYNPFGWGVYGNSYIGFKNYDEAIETVGRGIHTGYILKGANTVEKIAPIYAPPNFQKWTYNVRNYMRMIENS